MPATISDADFLGQSDAAAPAPAPANAAPAAPPSMPYDTGPNGYDVFRNSDGSIRALGTGVTVKVNTGPLAKLPAEESSTDDPQVIAHFLETHPEDIANKLSKSAPAAPLPSGTVPAGSGPESDAAFLGDTAQPAAAPAPVPAQPALPPPNVYAATPPALTAPVGLGDTFLRSVGATVRQAANAVSFGLANKLDAATAALPSIFKGGLGAFQPQYTSNMNAEEAQDQADFKQVPFASVPSAVAGNLAQAALLPEVKAASLMGRAAIGAGQAGLLSGLNAAGNARGNAAAVGQATFKPMLEGAAVGAPFGAVLGAGVRGLAGQQAATLADHAAAGVDPMLAVSGPGGLQRVGQQLHGLPFVGGPIQQAAKRTAAQFNAGVSNLASSLGNAQTRADAGAATVQGAQNAIGRLQATNSALYQPLNALEESAHRVPAINTSSTINNMMAKYPNIPDWITQHAPALASVQKTLASAGGRLTYGELKAMRTDVGSLMQKGALLPDISGARLKQLYGAMSKDMETAAHGTAYAEATAQGAKPIEAGRIATAARQQLLAANSHNAGMHDIVDNVLGKIVGAKSDEAAFDAVVAAASGGPRANIQHLQALKQHFSPDDWNTVAGATIYRMGRAADDSFSVAKFDSALKAMTPEGKQILFGDNTRTLDALGAIARQQKAASAFYNHSNSSNHLLGGLAALEVAQQLMEHEPKEAMATMALAPLGWAAAHLLAHPGFARIVLGASKARTPGAMALVDHTLLNYANDNAPVANMVQQYRSQLMANARANFGVGIANAGVGRFGNPNPQPDMTPIAAGASQR